MDKEKKKKKREGEIKIICKYKFTLYNNLHFGENLALLISILQANE